MAARSAARRPPYLFRLLQARPRQVTAAALVVVIIPLLPAEWRLVTRLLVAWDVAVAFYLVLAVVLMRGATVAHIRARAALEDEGRGGMLVLTTIAALASLGAIVAELSLAVHVDGAHRPAQLILTIATIVLSWGLIHVVFAFHYAHEYYDEDESHGGLKFPGDDEPDYLDFAYFSFVIGMTSQVSDVAVASRSIRRTATAHGILSFFFNTALLALMINAAASIL